MTILHADFRRLAAARKIMGAGKAAPDLALDRASAERWIARFASGNSSGNAGGNAGGSGEAAATPQPVVGPHATTFRPAGAAAAGEGAMRVFYIHGGGMVYYSTATFAPLLQWISDELYTTVQAFDYLKAPEHDIADSIAQLVANIVAQVEHDALQGDSRPILLAGDSVGGLLALYIATRVLPQRFARLLLLYPVLDLQHERASYHDFGDGYFLDASAMRRFKAFLQPYFSRQGFDPFVLTAADLGAFPPCTLVSAGCDVLFDEGLAWLDTMQCRQKVVQHLQFDDLPHDFCLYFGKLPVARQAVAEILSAFQPK